MNEDNAAHALLKLPRKGEAALFQEACQMLGFQVSGDGVYCEGRHLASIRNNRLVVNEVELEALSLDLEPLNTQRKIELNRIYFRLNADRVAIHEAGHGVAALLKQVDFCYIRVGMEHEIQLCSMWNLYRSQIVTQASSFEESHTSNGSLLLSKTKNWRSCA